ncbi:MAG TPA: PadR family transcriptional regulator [Solirubrobacteraceae bacterium]|nr:PadR family transcriptional regulator [Solirubrobacteraceae bacterium]
MSSESPIREEIELTTTSFIVLGLLAMAGEATPYDLKQMVGATVGNFWSLPHSQVYAEPERLARTGYLSEQRESTGRRRRRYSLTDSGRAAFEQWLNVFTAEPYALRDLGLLKLFFGGDVHRLATAQVELHRSQLAEYEAISQRAASGDMPQGPRLALELGIRHERETVHFWEEQLAPFDA